MSKATKYAVATNGRIWDDDLHSTIEAAKRHAETYANQGDKVTIYKCEVAATATTRAKLEWK